MRSTGIEMTKFLLALLALAAPLAAEDLGCTVTKVERKVEISRAEGVWEAATAGMRLVPGDRIHTGFKALCAVKFPDGSAIEVKPMSLVLLQKLDDGQGHLKSRVWLRLGEINAKVNRSTGAAADFDVQTPTTTASVRGTFIRRICAHPGIGTIVEMGDHGLLSVNNRKGRAGLPQEKLTQVRDSYDTPDTPEHVDLSINSAQIQPEGTTGGELEDILDLGVPKTNPFAMGGSGFLSTAATLQTQSNAPTPQPVAGTTRVTVNIPVLP